MRDHERRKGVKEVSLLGHKEVPHGFGLRTGDGGITADSAEDCGRPALLSMDYWEEPGVQPSFGLLFLFPAIWYP